MRPLVLEFQAFGSYPRKEVVDFRALAPRGLFVVTGPTGSGKTTVFDAMVFALYGVLPGARGASKKGECRSDFAAAETETYVQLTFEVDGTCYTVRRTPTQPRPKVRGVGVTEVSATATVVRHTASGDESLASRPLDATQVCTDLVGLDPAQFQRVVLLPQGKFSEFLLAADTEREGLLRPLFGTHLYGRATELLNDTVKRLAVKVQKVAGEVEHHRTNAVAALGVAGGHWLGDDAPEVSTDTSDAELRSMIEQLEHRRAEHERQLEAARTAARAATERRTAAVDEASRFDDARRHADELAHLQQRQSQVESAAARARDSARARPVDVAAARVDVELTRLHTVETKRSEVEAEVRTGLDALGLAGVPVEAAAVAAAVENAAAADAAQRTLLNEATRASALAAELEADLVAKRSQVASAEQELATSIQAAQAFQRTIDELEPVAAQVGVRELASRAANERSATHADLIDQQHALAEAIAVQKTARDALDASLEQFIATQAPLLAEQLVDGEPCAVCGSTQHPQPAQPVEGKVVGHRELAAAQQRQAEAGSDVAAVVTRIDGLRATLGDAADHPAEHFAAEVARTLDDLEVARSAETALASARTSFAGASTQVDTLRVKLETVRSEVDTLVGVATNQRIDADRLAALSASVDVAVLERRAATITSLRTSAASLAPLFGEFQNARGALANAQQALAEALATSGYADVASARAALQPIETETAALEEHATWTTSVATATTALATLREQGVPDDRPDIEALSAVERSLSEEATQLSTAFTTASNALIAAGDELDAAAALSADSATLQADYDTARIVYRTCNGEGPVRVKMERWVLSSELGRVTDAANVHLRRMTNRRYTLQRDETKGGLGLLVSDSHSGTQRATASLSGGEQFQASLALALGLADVVSQGGTANGRTFEALFVDEGFGSLDPDALLQAIDALEGLHAAGRMVGAITHVDAMKQSLHVGIEVTRLPGGGSTLTVRP